MSVPKSDEWSPTVNRSMTASEHEQIDRNKQENDDQQNIRSTSNSEGQTTVILRSEEIPVPLAIRPSHSSNNSINESNHSRSKTVSTNTSDVESTSTGFHFLQSIKDLTHQELSRANPLGLLGKEVIFVTGTTHCPEPIPPQEDDETVIHTGGHSSTSSSVSHNKRTPITEMEPQQIRFPLNEQEKIQMQKRRSTLGNLIESALPPCPGEFLLNPANNDVQPYLFSQPSPGTMIADFIPDTMTINVFEVFIYAWGVFAFFLDMITDLVLAHAYYSEGAYWLFILTLMCVIVPNLTLSVFSLVWYIDGSQLKAEANEKQTIIEHDTSIYETNFSNDILEKDQQENINNSEFSPLHGKQNSSCQTDDWNSDDQIDAHVSRLKQRIQTPEKDEKQGYQTKSKHFQLPVATANVLTWIIRIIILVLQLDLCLKYIRGLYYTWKGFQKRHNPKWQRFYLTKQILIDADIALLRVFDCFMDSGSQVILQLYIMLRLGSAATKFDTLFLKQCLSIGSSLGSLAYALSGYSRCWRHMQLTHSPQGWPKGKPPPQLVSWWSTIMQWVWYLFLITPRVLALAMFAATFRSWFWIILIAHWCAMLFWILRFRTIFCISDQTKYNPREAIFEKCYNLVCSYIFIFCYMNLRKGDTLTHYIAFYTIYYIENIAFSIIYAIHSAETNLILKYSLVTFVCGGFWFAVLFQFFYYRFLHPSDHVRLSTKQNISSIVHVRALTRFDRMKKSKSCEEMIGHNDLQNFNENNELMETTSLHLDTSMDERWHNRFSLANRRKLISQQQAIDQKVKLTRLEEATKRQPQSARRFLTKIATTLKRPTTISTSLVTESSDPIQNQPTKILPSDVNNHSNHEQRISNVPRVTLTKSPSEEPYAQMHQINDEEEENIDRPSIVHIPDKRTRYYQKQSKMYNIDEDTQSVNTNTNNVNIEGGEEMILTAAKLKSHIMPLSSSMSAINDNTSSSSLPANVSLC